MSINKFRSALYTVAKIAGDVQAIAKGPAAIQKRLARRWLGSLTARGLGRLFR